MSRFSPRRSGTGRNHTALDVPVPGGVPGWEVDMAAQPTGGPAEVSAAPRTLVGVTIAPEGRKLLRLEVRNAETPIERKPEWIKTRMSPHHCSKKAMYEDNNLQQDVMTEFEDGQLSPGYIVASSNEFPSSNSPGDNPPHVIARRRYEEIVNDQFLCTGEVSTPENVRPIIFTVTAAGIELVGDDYEMSDVAENALAAAIAKVRGTSTPPVTKVGFGKK